MTVGLEDIRAWVDGELDEPRAGQVEKAILSDAGLQQTADKLRASQLPYREAYEQTPVPDMPDSLRVSIEALRNPAVKNTAVENTTIENLTNDRSTIHRLNDQNLPTDAANNGSFKTAGIAASVVIAALIGCLGYLAGANKATQVTPDTTASVVDTLPTEDFAQTVAAYQKFYVRETLKGTVPPNPAKVTERLAAQTDMRVVIPELEGYEFMRAQRLSIDGELLLQLVYLGAEGVPLALCYMVVPEDGSGREQNNVAGKTTFQNHHGLNTVEWRQNGNRFVIVSDAPEKKLTELSRSTQQQWKI